MSERYVVNRWIIFVLLLSVTAVCAANKTSWQSGKKYTLKSKRFSWAYYEDQTQSLIICNHQGGATEYYGVPQVVFEAFMDARLKGSIYSSRIDRKFPKAKVWVKQRKNG